MEPNLPVIAKKFWSMVKVAFFMLRKGISKRKIMLDLNMMMKRGKIVGKALQNLMFHHSHIWATAAAAAATSHRRSDDRHLPFTDPENEYEFSCSNSPAANPSFHLPFNLMNKRRSHHLNLFSRTHPPLPEDDVLNVALEMIQSEAASPALPGFGKTPMVRQLRITDSPFPLRDTDQEDSRIDEAAEQFILKFYNDLKRQSQFSP